MQATVNCHNVTASDISKVHRAEENGASMLFNRWWNPTGTLCFRQKSIIYCQLFASMVRVWAVWKRVEKRKLNQNKRLCVVSLNGLDVMHKMDMICSGIFAWMAQNFQQSKDYIRSTIEWVFVCIVLWREIGKWAVKCMRGESDKKSSGRGLNALKQGPTFHGSGR